MNSKLGADPDGHISLSDAPAQYNPTPAEADVIAEMMSWAERAEEAKSPHMRNWELVRCFIRGDQSLYQNAAGELVRVSTQKKSRRLLSVNNQMKLAARQLLAKLTKHIPEFTVGPANGDQDQVYAALAATEFIRWFRHKEDFEIKYLAALRDTTELGNGLLLCDWDPSAGRRMVLCPVCDYMEESADHVDEPCPACQMEIQAEQEQYHESMALYDVALELGNLGAAPPIPPAMREPGVLAEFLEGDVVLDYLDPQEFLPEPGCYELKKMRTWGVRRVVPVSTLRAKYPDFADVIQAKRGLFSFNGIKSVSTKRDGSYGYDEFCEHGTETVIYSRPSAMYPKGRRVVILNDSILARDDENHLHFLKRPNVYAFHWDKENSSFWSQSFGEHAWHRQKELNENERQQRENAELMANGKILVAANSGVRPDELVASTGPVVRYSFGTPKPEPLRFAGLPPEVYNRGGIVKGSIFEQATIGQAEQGLMSGDVSGRALAIIQAEADQQIGPTLTRIFHEVGELFKGCVQVFRHFASNERQYRVVGDMGLQIFTLKDMDLADGYDLRVEPDDGLSKNQQLRLNSMMDLVQLPGAFTNPQTGMLDFPRFAKAAKLKIPGIGADKTTAQRTRAQYLLRQIENGEFTVQPQPWDDPIAHAEAFLDWLQTKGYKPDMDPAVVQYVYAMFQFYMQMVMFNGNGGMGQAPVAPGEPGNRQEAAQSPGPGGQNARVQTVAGQAASTVQAADRASENAARSRFLPREG